MNANGVPPRSQGCREEQAAFAFHPKDMPGSLDIFWLNSERRDVTNFVPYGTNLATFVGARWDSNLRPAARAKSHLTAGLKPHRPVKPHFVS
jgi:hypothetical protein